MPGQTVPWSGESLGLVNAELITGCAPARLIGVVGLPDAGKSTFLLTHYLQISRGQSVAGYRFAGSRTLKGWESLSRHFRTGARDTPRFPPHTTLEQGRTRGLLHLALRHPETTRIEELLIADAPGEWFAHWAVQREHPAAEGARWLAEYADAFMLFIDSAALSGNSSVQALMDHRLLALRLADERRRRPVTLVWSKSDQQVTTAVRERVEGVVRPRFSDAPVFQASSRNPEGRETIHAAVASLVEQLEHSAGVVLPEPNEPPSLLWGMS